MLEKPENYLQKNESRALSYTIKWKWTQNWLKTNVRSDTRKLEENINHTFFDISLSNIFFLDLSPQARTTKAKINQQNNIELKSFCISDEIINKIKRKSTEWEKIFANDISDKGLIFKVYKNYICQWASQVAQW